MIEARAHEPLCPRASVEPAPSWVRNVAARPHSTAGMAAMVVQRAYKVIAVFAAAGAGPLLVWSWLAPADALVVALRCVSTLAVLTLTPVLWLRWAVPPTTVYIFCTRRGLWPAGAGPVDVAVRRVALEDVAPAMRLAVIVSEDPYFFWHVGFNPVEMLRALRYNRRERRPGRMRRGGSTISQQVAKNLFLLPTQSYLRKVVEAAFTIWIEGLWPKRRILETYLNVVQFGDGVFGVEAAAQRFFAVPARALTAEQAALLTAALRRPQVFRVEAPGPHMRELQRGILERMAWCGEGMLAQLD